MGAQAADMHIKTALLLSIAAAACGGAQQDPAPAPARAAKRPAGSTYTTARTGDLHDFDSFAGAWRLENKRLKVRGVGSTDWDEFPAVSCTIIHLGGVANVDEIHFPTKGWSGLTLRTFDTEKHQWSIYWVNSRTGQMFSPVVGGFDGDRGEFYGEDTDDGKPILVRFEWTKQGPDRAHWQQAFSSDGGVTWEVNWMNDLVRADPSTCDNGRPRS
jgi:hypothetical protein